MRMQQNIGMSSPAPLSPIPAFIIEAAGAERGLICGFRFEPGRPPRELGADAAVESLGRTDAVTWLHFNLSEQRARRWLLESSLLPGQMRELLAEHDENRRIESVDGGMLVVMSDFAFEPDADPAEVAPLWCFANVNTLITARTHPLRSIDDLRQSMRTSRAGGIASGFELIAQLFAVRTAHLRQRAHGMIVRLDDIEDEILAGDIREQREHLGRTRRVCARWRRQFAPERADLNQYLHRDGETLPASDREALKPEADSLGFALEEIAELYERAKLLQEELASRLAESTGRNLYVLSVLTAVLLPMTLVTGIFGMNVPGMPGTQGPGAFWHVMFLVVASGVATLVWLIWRKLL